MFIRQLSYLIALDKHRHFGRAAESCNVSQPALSNALRELERELGFTIIERNRTFQGITPEGARVIPWAKQTLASLEGLRQDAGLIRGEPTGHLVIGFVPTAAYPAMLLSAEYRRKMPKLSFEALNLSTAAILEGLKNQNLHFGLLYARSVTSDAFEMLPLFSERYVLVAASQAALPQKLGWAEISKLPLGVLSRGIQSRQMIDKIFKELMLTPNIVFETNSLSVLVWEATNGRVFSVMPHSALPTRYVRGIINTHTIIPMQTEDVCLVRLRRQIQPCLSKESWRLAENLGLQEVLNEAASPQP
jgi:DNA-binding transcriptional LysR family regulator